MGDINKDFSRYSLLVPVEGRRVFLVKLSEKYSPKLVLTKLVGIQAVSSHLLPVLRNKLLEDIHWYSERYKVVPDVNMLP